MVDGCLSIPYVQFKQGIYIKKQVCVIPFRRDFLIKYNKMKPTPLETINPSLFVMSARLKFTPAINITKIMPISWNPERMEAIPG